MLKKQISIDLTEPLTGENQFVYGKGDQSMRLWARNDGMILIMDGILLCRVDDPLLLAELKKTYQKADAQWFGEVKNLKRLKSILTKYQYEVVNYGPFFTPSNEFDFYKDPSIRLYERDTLEQFKSHPIFTEPLCFDPFDKDVLAMGIEHEGEVVALAGMNHNGKHALELGIEVMDTFQKKGYATRLIKAITSEAMKRYPDKIILYGTQFTHNLSINVAIRAGFKHAWTEIVLQKTK